jgi:signal transduction histidine kinase
MKETKILKSKSEEFAFLAAHQLKTPLTAIRWYVGELENAGEEMLSREQKNILKELRATVVQMSDMLNSLLQIGRIRSGRLNVQPAPLDIADFCKNIILEMEPVLKEKKVTVDFNTEPAILPLVKMDKELFRHVLWNLLSNSVSYSSKGSEVKVSVKQKDGVMEVSVKDQGIGIPQTEQKKIFQEFFRAKNASRLQPKGTGLGLALVKYIVEHWKGKIGFKSQENKGTTFYFTIPVKGIKPKKGEVGLEV